MATLTGQTIASTYDGLLKLSDNDGLTASVKNIEDGFGVASPVNISTAVLFIKPTSDTSSTPTSGKEFEVVGNALITGDLQIDNINIDGNTISATSGVVTLSNGTIATTQSQSDNSTKVATTAYVDTSAGNYLPLAGGTMSGSIAMGGNNISGGGTATFNSFVGDLTGNADTATALETARTIQVSGDIAGSASFDGTADINISTTIQPNSVALGTDTTGNYVATISGTANEITVSDSGSESAAVTISLPSSISVDVTGDLRGDVYNADGSIILNTGDNSIDAVLSNGVRATTQSASDNSTKIATTAYVDNQVTIQDLDFAGDSGTGSVDLDSQTFTVAGGTNVTTSVSGQTVTINATGSVDGSGTANDVVMWFDSDTLTDAPIAISGNNATFAGNVALNGLTNSDYDADADNLVLGASSGNTGITILSGSSASNFGSIYFADGTSSTAAKAGFIRYEQNTSEMTFGINAVQKLGIALDGTATFAGNISVTGTTFLDGDVTVGDTSSAFIGLARAGLNYIAATNPSGQLVFRTGGTTAALTLDASQNATFAGKVSAFGNSDTVPAIDIYSDSNHGLRILHRATDGDFSFERRVSGTNTEFLRIGRSTGNATFAGSVTITQNSGSLEFSNTGSGHGSITTGSSKDLNIGSASGNVFINNNTTFAGGVSINHGSGDTLTLTKSTTEPSLRIEGDTDKDFVITVSGELLTFTQNDGATDILKLDHDTKNATFAANITAAGTLEIGTHSAFAIKLQKSDGTYQPFAATSANHTYLYNNDAAGSYLFRNAADSSTLFELTNAGVATFAGNITATGTSITLDSAGSADFIADRINTSSGSSYQYKTNGTLKWYHGLRGLVNDDFYLVNASESTNALIITESGSNATFAGEVKIEMAAPKLQLKPTTQNNASIIELGVLNGGTNAYARIDAINLNNYDTNLRFYTNAAGSTTQVERMRIDSSGLVRIQKNTASTTEPLLKLSNANGSTTDGVKMIFEVANTSGNGGEIAVVRDGGSFNPYMTFNVSSGVSSAPSERMRIDSSGNVGIGTSSPQGILQLNVDSDHSIMRITAGDSSIAGIDFGKTSDIDDARIRYYNSTRYMEFFVANGERMRITSSGNVGIGNTNPSGQLDILTSNETMIKLRNSDSTSGKDRDFKLDDNNKFEILDNSGTGVSLSQGSTSWSSESDERLKENIVELDSVLENIDNLRAVKYNYKNGNDTKIGFIAQDWQEDFSEIIEEGEHLSMKYTETIPVLLKAIQELKQEIEILKNK